MINQICIIINGTSVVNQAGLDVGQEDTSDVDKYNASTVKKNNGLDDDIGKHDVHSAHGDHLELLELV